MDADLTGKLLIALPGIGDPRFARSIILVCAHSPEFAMGIVLNKPMVGLTLPQLLEQLDVPVEIDVSEDLVLDGGPVSSDRGFVLHTDDIISEYKPMVTAAALTRMANTTTVVTCRLANPIRNWYSAKAMRLNGKPHLAIWV